MKLNYDSLISPYPLKFTGIGSIRCPKLSDIWNPDITYRAYMLYIMLLMMTPQRYCEEVNPEMLEWYKDIEDEDKANLTMIDIIQRVEDLQKQYAKVFDFFFEENVVWNNYEECFITYTDLDENGIPIPVGVIHAGIYNEVCNIILQRCNTNKEKKSTRPKFKNKIAEKIWLKTHKDEENEDYKKMEIPNLISSVAGFSKTLNILNIWDLTVYQLYDQFMRIHKNVFFEISSTSVAAYGDKDGKFDSDQWYEEIKSN